MKGTIGRITGQESGFIVRRSRTGGWEAILDNWAADPTEYECDLRTKRRIANVWRWLEERIGCEDIEVEADDGVIAVTRRLRYACHANDVTERELHTPGTLFDFGAFLVLAPQGWG